MKKRILIADDDPGLQEIFQIVLKKAGYDIEIKQDAQEIFDNKFTIPDVFLVDKILSGINGLEVCRFLKSNKHTRNIPVIMVSGTPDIGTASAEAGADDFVEKPFELGYLLQVIERNINDARNGKLKNVS